MTASERSANDSVLECLQNTERTKTLEKETAIKLILRNYQQLNPNINICFVIWLTSKRGEASIDIKGAKVFKKENTNDDQGKAKRMSDFCAT